MSKYDLASLHINLLEENVELLYNTLKFERERNETRLKQLNTKNIEEKKLLNKQNSKYQVELQHLSKKYNIKCYVELRNEIKKSPFYIFSHSKKRLLKVAGLIAKSSYFDAHWYEEKYCLNSLENPLSHFISNESTLKYNPSIFFNVKKYTEKYADVRDSGLSPLVHYIQYGKSENRRIYKVT